MPTNSEGTNTLKHELHAQIHKELKTPSFKVMQVLTNNVALAHAGEKNMARHKNMCFHLRLVRQVFLYTILRK
jgi:hypothetical protein